MPRSHRAIEFRPARPCARCGCAFTPTRTDAKFCSAACKQAAWRASRPRPTIALVTWHTDDHNDVMASWTFHHSHAAALAAAPTAGEPYSIVNIAVAATIQYPSIDELIGRRRYLETPYPRWRPGPRGFNRM
jgi:hypothetical protein